jgi:hypothetical protein
MRRDRPIAFEMHFNGISSVWQGMMENSRPRPVRPKAAQNRTYIILNVHATAIQSSGIASVHLLGNVIRLPLRLCDAHSVAGREVVISAVVQADAAISKFRRWSRTSETTWTQQTGRYSRPTCKRAL